MDEKGKRKSKKSERESGKPERKNISLRAFFFVVVEIFAYLRSFVEVSANFR